MWRQDQLGFVVDLLTNSRASEWVSIDRTKEAVSEAVKDLEQSERLSGFAGWIDKLNLDKKNLGISNSSTEDVIEISVGTQKSYRATNRRRRSLLMLPADFLRFLLTNSKPGTAAIAPLPELLKRLRERHRLGS